MMQNMMHMYACTDVWGARPEMRKLRKEMNLPFGCGLTPYPASMVDMIFGQPAAKFTYRSIQLLIPYMVRTVQDWN